MIDYHIHGLNDPDVEIPGMPCTQALWAEEDPYDHPGTDQLFTDAVRENLERHMSCPFYSDWLHRTGFLPKISGRWMISHASRPSMPTSTRPTQSRPPMMRT